MKWILLAALLALSGCAAQTVKKEAGPTSIIGIGNCEKYVSILLIDEHGVIYPFDADDVDLPKIKAAADKLSEGHVIVVKICPEGVGT